MPKSPLPYQFALEITGPKGQDLGQHRITPSWEAGRQWLRFEILRKHGPRQVTDDEITVMPQWSPNGPPYVGAVRVAANGDSVELAPKFFHTAARPVASQLVAEGQLEKGDLYTYRVLAYERRESATPATAASRFEFHEEPPPLHVVDKDLASLLARATLVSPPKPAADNGLLVFAPESIVDEIMTQAREADENETGGVLIGHLYRDPVRQKLAVEITANIPARHTTATSWSLSFTDETWTDVQAALDLRRSHEQQLAWQHSHPAKHWCPQACTMDQRLLCTRQLAFFSEDDVILHATVFPRAWHVALLANNADSGLTLSCYGWDHGVVRQRPFHILDATRSHAAAPVADDSDPGGLIESKPENHHATPIE